MIEKRFIVSSTNSLEGYSIVKYLDVLTDRIVVGAGMLSEFFASFTDAFGDRSIKFENRIEELHEIAMANIKKKAIAAGANALIGIRLDTDEISGKNMQMFMATVTGTAVIIMKKTENEKIYIEEEYNNIISANTVENMVLINKYSKKLSEDKLLFSDFTQIIYELIKQNILIPLNIVLNTIIKFTYPNDYSNDKIDDITNYLLMYSKSDITEELNKAIIESTSNNNLLNILYSKIACVNYEDILNLINKVDVRILDKTILNVLMKYKQTYESKDIEYIELLIEKLNGLLEASIVEEYRGTLTNGWICICGNKNTGSSDKCKLCFRGKNGFTDGQSIQINMVIEHLNNIKLVLMQSFNKDRGDGSY